MQWLIEEGVNFPKKLSLQLLSCTDALLLLHQEQPSLDKHDCTVRQLRPLLECLHDMAAIGTINREVPEQTMTCNTGRPNPWAARYNTWLRIRLPPKGAVLSFFALMRGHLHAGLSGQQGICHTREK